MYIVAPTTMELLTVAPFVVLTVAMVAMIVEDIIRREKK